MAPPNQKTTGTDFPEVLAEFPVPLKSPYTPEILTYNLDIAIYDS